MDEEKTLHHTSAVKKLPPIEAKQVLLPEKFKTHKHKEEDDLKPLNLPVGRYRPIASKGEPTPVVHHKKKDTDDEDHKKH